MVDGIVDAGRAEVLIVDGPGVVVTSRGVDRHIHSIECLLYFTRDELGVHGDLFIGVAPSVVGTIVTSPED